MALTIRQQDQVFKVEGIINSTTVKQFRNHMEFLLLYTKSVTIDIDAVKAIDTKGMKALRELYAKAIIYKKEFLIVGYGCKEIYEDFKMNFAS